MAASENENEKKIEQHDHHQDEQQHRNKKRKQVFPYGNYRAYYGYRLGQHTEEDPRLKVFKKEWFEGKDCLDIGCNAGIITIQIGKYISKEKMRNCGVGWKLPWKARR